MWHEGQGSASRLCITALHHGLTGFGGVSIVTHPATDFIYRTSDFTMAVNHQIHAQLVKAGVRLAATLPDDWVNSLIRRVAKDNVIRHVPVGREAETIAVCAGAFFGGVRAVAIIGNTGLLTCTGEMA